MIEGSCHCAKVRWRFQGIPEGATACNCTVCRRYGTLWAYDYEGEGIEVSGPTQAYIRGKAIEFHFCPSCGCVAYWRAQGPGEDGRRRIAVNLRLTEPQAVARVPIDHFDGWVAEADGQVVDEKNGFVEIARHDLPERFPVMAADSKFYRRRLAHDSA